MSPTRILAISIASAWCAGPAGASPGVLRAEIEWTDPAKRERLAGVLVNELAGKPAPGTYLLLDTNGVAATFSSVSSSTLGGPCSTQARFVIDRVLHVPRDRDHVVVVGPLASPASNARLMFLGLAGAGHGTSAKRDPLGVALPDGREPTYAVDLDGDGAADLAMFRIEQHGPFVRGVADVKRAIEQWAHERTWRRTARCDWTTRDTIR